MAEMTVREKKRFLSDYTRLTENIAEDRKEAERLRAQATCIQGMALSGMPHNPNRAKDPPYAKIIRQLVDLEHIIELSVEKSMRRRRDILESILTLKSPTERLVITMRYVDGLCWCDIREQMKLSERAVYKIHCNALNHIQIRRENEKSGEM